MMTIQAVWISFAAALALANLPFLRLVMPPRWHPAAADFAGWLAGYAVWMRTATLLELNAGKLAAKNWEIWAISAALFAVLAFPGVVWRHLLRK